MRLLICLIFWIPLVNAADLVRVNAFPNAKALPLHAGLAKGIFEKHGLKV